MQKKKMEIINLDGIDELLRQKMIEEADRYEQEINSDSSLDGIEPDPAMLNKILAAIEKEEGEESEAESLGCRPEDLLSEEDRRALEYGRKHMAHPMRRRCMHAAGIAAAVMVGIFGASISIEANREKLMEVMNILVANESVARVNNETDRYKYSDEEERARADIEEKLGVSPVTFMYMPSGMVFEDYVVDEVSGFAKLFYKYKDTIVYATMEKRNMGLSDSEIRDGDIIKSLDVETDLGKVRIIEIQGPDEKDYLAELVYNECYYSIYGILSEEEFVKMIEKIKIY